MYLSNRRANMEMGLNLEYAKFWDRLFFLPIKINQIIKKQKFFFIIFDYLSILIQYKKR